MYNIHVYIDLIIGHVLTIFNAIKNLGDSVRS